MGRHLALIALAGLVACNAQASPGAAQTTADAVTKAVYADDVDGVTSRFDAQLQSQVSRAEVGALSDKLHLLGDYKGLTAVGSDPAKNEYSYNAQFEKRVVTVVVRMDTDGKLSAYRIFEQ